MNLQQMYARVLFHANRTRSARFHRNRKLDVAINIAINDLLNNRIDMIKSARGKPYYFESVRRVKTELSSVVRSDVALTLVGDFATKPTDMFYPLSVFATINGVRRWCEEMLFNSYGPHLTNNLSRPSPEYPKWLDEQGIHIKYAGGINALTAVDLSYVKKPIIVKSGPALSTAPNNIVSGSEYGVISGSVTYDGTTYGQDEYFTGTAATGFTGTGTVALLTNTDLGEPLHEEVCRRAAQILMGSVENFEKQGAKEAENMGA